jgi:CRISPR/Cas system CSM-associated protein Csm3 (group 7 of RAMP superfamily)
MPPYKPVPQFTNRWLFLGTLTTRSPLHVGDGESALLHQRATGTPVPERPIRYSTICRDHEDKAYIPGSSIKGSLRALVLGLHNQEDAKGGLQDGGWASLLGWDNPSAQGAEGGKLEFWDAFHVGGKGTNGETIAARPTNLEQAGRDRRRPWWVFERRTCVAVGVSLDRRTRSARKKLLDHLEYVPAGETFQLEISGDNLSDQEALRALALLHRLDSGAARLGAQASNDWGCVSFRLEKVCRLDQSNLEAWASRPEPGLSALPPLANHERDQMWQEAGRLTISAPPRRLVFHLELTFASPWIIRDPRQRERVDALRDGNANGQERPPGMSFVVDEDGRPFVPAESLRGALRARAEMILRTLGLHCDKHPAEIEPVCTRHQTTAGGLEAVGRHDLAARLFGMAGWMGPLRTARLTSQDQPTAPLRQESVAIDRFTGGAADELKFDAELATESTLQGELTLDLDRLAAVDPKLASLGLLLLVLRDLVEGDIPIGAGSSRGQGWCAAEVSVKELATHPIAGDPPAYSSLADWCAGSKPPTSGQTQVNLPSAALNELRSRRPSSTPLHEAHA